MGNGSKVKKEGQRRK